MSEAVAKVKSIFVYPIKSCKGISVDQAPITSTGFRWDRQWMVVNEKRRMYSQRNKPKLALVEVELPGEAFSEAWEPSSNSYMVVRAPGLDVLKIPLTKPHDTVSNVTIWNWTGSAWDEGEAAAQWFSIFLGKTSRLIRFDPASQTRSTDPNYASGYRTMFSDQYPFLLVSQESLDALNKNLKEPVHINRFRPNILVEGCEPFSEDLWKEIGINNLTFYGVKLCPRCKLPNINQETGISGPEPTETLKEFRSDKVLFLHKKPRGLVYFGQSLVCKECFAEGKGRVVQVGDPVHVMQQVLSIAEAPA